MGGGGAGEYLLYGWPRVLHCTCKYSAHNWQPHADTNPGPPPVRYIAHTIGLTGCLGLWAHVQYRDFPSGREPSHSGDLGEGGGRLNCRSRQPPSLSQQRAPPSRYVLASGFSDTYQYELDAIASPRECQPGVDCFTSTPVKTSFVATTYTTP